MMPFMSGPCVIEDEGLIREIASELKSQLAGLPIDFYFKASFDKANRSSIEGFRGPGLDQGLKILERVRSEFGFKLVTDFHTPDQAESLARVVDVMQIPAFLCRQTDMIVAATEAALKHGRRINVKKGQFLAPHDTKNIVEKVEQVLKRAGSSRTVRDVLWLTERGSSFGYNTLTVDMSSFQVMKSYGVDVIYDATHSVQSPGAGAGGKSTGGKREFIECLSRAAMAAGADGIFMECHPRPEVAKSDGPNAFYLKHVGAYVRQMLEIKKCVSGLPKLL